MILTADHTRKHGYHVNSNYDADKMMLCVRLIEKVQNEDYLMEMVTHMIITHKLLKFGVVHGNLSSIIGRLTYHEMVKS